MKNLFKKIVPLLAAAFLFNAMAGSVALAAGNKVLYVTHEPGRYHKYTPQKEIFIEKIAKPAGWDVTVMTGSYDGLIEKLHDPNFAQGYDAVVYNYCLAESPDLESCANVIRQTRELGVPALLIHCAMHSWWDTYKRGEADALGPDYHGKARAVPARVQEWKAKHGDAPFPAYGDFTGVASVQHGPQSPIQLHKLKEHPATARLPEGFTTPNTELYNNFYIIDGVEPLVEGTQRNAKAVVVWTCPQGKSRVLGITLGHGEGEWNLPEFQHLITDSVNFLLEHPQP